MILFQNWFSPVGQILLISTEDTLLMCDWIDGAKHIRGLNRLKRFYPEVWQEADSGVMRQTRSQIQEFCSGSRRDFSIKYLASGTRFQKLVWAAVSSIPYGETMSYADIANMIGKKSSVRAVANAIANNPLPLIIPCHRIIGSNGSVSGYSGGIWNFTQNGTALLTTWDTHFLIKWDSYLRRQPYSQSTRARCSS